MYNAPNRRLVDQYWRKDVLSTHVEKVESEEIEKKDMSYL